MKKTAIILLFSLFYTGNIFAQGNDLDVDLLKGEYDSVISASGRQSSSPEALYYQGLAYLKKNDFKNARNALEQALKNVRSEDLKFRVILAVGDTYFLERDFSNALSNYEKLLKDKLNGGITPLVLLRCSQSNIKLGNWDQGGNYLQRLRNEYPNSMECQLAESISISKEVFCVQVGSFGDEVNAKEFAKKLRAEGYDSYLDCATVDNKPLYRVRVGTCATIDEAERLKSTLNSCGYDTKIYP